MCTKNQLTYISQQITQTAKAVLGDKYDCTLLYGSYTEGNMGSPDYRSEIYVKK